MPATSGQVRGDLSCIDGGEAASWRRLDNCRRRDHCYLESEDDCRYLWDYRPGHRRDPVRRLIADFKCSPSLAAADPDRFEGKRLAIERIARVLRSACTRDQIESFTWVPVPPSSAAADVDFDDRLSQALRRAFGHCALDLRPLLVLVRGTPSDHTMAARLGLDQLQALMRIDQAMLAAAPPRGAIAVFDDLLTAGKHFRCCERHLHQALPGIAVSGWFLARRALSGRWRGEGGRCA